MLIQIFSYLNIKIVLKKNFHFHNVKCKISVKKKSKKKINNNIGLTNEVDQIGFCLIFLFVNTTTVVNTLFTLIGLLPLC
jgi:hypothetical protein